MPSLQESAGAGKAAKFAAANPLGPMANPFPDTVDDAASELREKMSADVDSRLKKAVRELQERHAAGTNEVDDEDRAPTGAAYQAQNEEIVRERRAAEERKRRAVADEARQRAAAKEEAKRLFANNDENNDDVDDDDSSVDSDDSLLKGLDDERPELEDVRRRRLEEMRAAQRQRADDLSRGHGQYRTISQDEFLPECTSSVHVAAHFYHDEFQRCEILDHHLKIVAPLHLSCKFVRIDAQKAPFFVSKLKIQTLPTLLVFKDGKVVDRLTGFDGLAVDVTDPDRWHTGRLRHWLASTGAIEYRVPTEEVREEMERMGLRPKGAIWSGNSSGTYEDEY